MPNTSHPTPIATTLFIGTPWNNFSSMFAIGNASLACLRYLTVLTEKALSTGRGNYATTAAEETRQTCRLQVRGEGYIHPVSLIYCARLNK